MSKTSSDTSNILHGFLKHSALMADPAGPTGGLFLSSRPVNSENEDIVINSLPINRDAVQVGVLNVNIYVPDLKIDFGGVSQYQPNTARLSELSSLFNTVLAEGEEIWEETGDYAFNIQQDNVFQDTNNQHYVNFRIEFYSINN